MIAAKLMQEAWTRVEPLVSVLQLPLRSRAWSGSSGNWAGSGVGSSIDFQDHRPYFLGDDPRNIDWQAFARTEHYSMKLYREEVSPQIDLVLDCSASMWESEAKTARVLDLLMFCVAGANQAGASLRCFGIGADKPFPIQAELLHACRAQIEPQETGSHTFPKLNQIPWRQAALRVWISDLLFPGNPGPALQLLTHAKGRGVLFVPFSEEEIDPDWRGNLEFESSEERGRIRPQRVDLRLLDKYRKRYAAHFELWRSEARRFGIRFARISSQGSLRDAFGIEAFPNGAVELWG